MAWTNTLMGYSSSSNLSKFRTYSGKFESTIKTSILTTTIRSEYQSGGISNWEDTDTLWMEGKPSTNHDYFVRVSGQYSTTVKNSLDIYSIDVNLSGGDWDRTNIIWTGAEADKIYVQSGGFTSTIKDSVSITADPFGSKTWDGNGISSNITTDKLYHYSGRITATIKTSIAVNVHSQPNSNPRNPSYDPTDNTTLFGTSNTYRMYAWSGIFSTTVRDSQTIGADLNSYCMGIDTDDYATRIPGGAPTTALYGFIQQGFIPFEY